VNNRVAAKIIIVMLTLWCAMVVIGYLYNVTITFPFSISDGHSVPEHRLHAIRLSLITAFIYFSIRYFFVGSVKLYPVQVLAIILFHLSVVGSLVFYFVFCRKIRVQIFLKGLYLNSSEKLKKGLI
jgi:hypothetical protein